MSDFSERSELLEKEKLLTSLILIPFNLDKIKNMDPNINCVWVCVFVYRMVDPLCVYVYVYMCVSVPGAGTATGVCVSRQGVSGSARLRYKGPHNNPASVPLPNVPLCFYLSLFLTVFLSFFVSFFLSLFLSTFLLIFLSVFLSFSFFFSFPSLCDYWVIIKGVRFRVLHANSLFNTPAAFLNNFS